MPLLRFPRGRRAGLSMIVSSILFFLGAVGLGSLISCRGPAKAPTPDSLLLITIDTLRADHVSCYGNSPVRTPNLDALGARGAIVRNAWATVPLTTPSHASILTGLYPPAHGVRYNSRFRLEDSAQTLAERLDQAGRKTAAFVASYTTSRKFGLAQGFETFDDDMGYTAEGSQRQQRPANEVIDRASAWLSSHATGPFFLWVHLYDPHAPYSPPLEFASAHPGDLYSGEVAFTDAQIGRLLDVLERSGARPRTIVAAMSDHGEGLGSRGEMEHGFLLYEQTLHIPFLIAADGHIPSGSNLVAPASTVDFVPTVLGIFGLKATGEIQGRDLFASSKEKDAPRRSIFAETLYPYEEFGWSPLYTMRQGSLKYIAAPVPELYDLEKDPSERVNLAATRAHDLDSLSNELWTGMRALVTKAGAARGGADDSSLDAEAMARLESLGYVGGGGGASDDRPDALPPVKGRNTRDAMEEINKLSDAQNAIAAGNAQSAIPVLESLRATDPDNPQVLLKLGKALSEVGRDEEANRIYAALVQGHPTFHVAYRAFSEFLEKRGRGAEAKALWVRAQRALPGFAGLEVQLAKAELAAKAPRDAASRLETYLRTRPDDAEAWGLMGLAQTALGHSDEALLAFRRVLDTYPTDKTALEGAVTLLVSSNRRPEAVKLVDGLLAKKPGDPVLLRAAEWLSGNLRARPRTGGAANAPSPSPDPIGH